MDQLNSNSSWGKTQHQSYAYNISIFNSFNNEPTTLIVEFIDQDEISSVINVKDVEGDERERST